MSNNLPLPFPDWDLDKSQKVTIWSTSIQACVLTFAFGAMLVNSMFGKKSNFVTLLSLAFIISDIALARSVVLFRNFQSNVVAE
jgi:hypothetical protein